jgi:lysine biosynthesis protein LysW
VAKAFCPGCRLSMELDRHIQAGDWVNCPRCEADLEVISLNPLVLDWADDEFENGKTVWSSRASAKLAKWGRQSKKQSARVWRDFDEME